MKKTNQNFRKLGAAALSSAVAYHLLSALMRDRVIEHKNVCVRSGKIPAELCGYKIAFITDTHYVSDEKLRDAMHQVRARKPDLLLLGGDFAHEREAVGRQLDIIGAVQPTNGIYGVCGNHDKQVILQEEMKARSMTLLANTGVSVRDRFYLCGVEDLLKGKPDTARAVEHAKEDDFTLLLSHNPDVSMRYPMSKVDLMLSGHTHGGQVCLFGIYAPALSFVSDYGQKFRAGRVSARGRTVYVSRGVGNHRRLFRVFAKPQILYLTLKGNDSAVCSV